MEEQREINDVTPTIGIHLSRNGSLVVALSVDIQRNNKPSLNIESVRKILMNIMVFIPILYQL